MLNIERYNRFVSEFGEYIKEYDNSFSNILILCIGTERLIGDSLGPRIGTNIKQVENENIKIYGTAKNNMDFLNSKNVIEQIYKIYNNPYIITIDAALGKKSSIGEIYLSDGCMKIGTALGKSICFYSNINIKCIVGEYSDCSKWQNYKILSNVSKQDIDNLVEIVSLGIVQCLKSKEIYVY